VSAAKANSGRWYEGVTGYHWLVLVVASLGWVFDIFEGQIFVASMEEAMPSLLPPGTLAGTIARFNNFALAAYLAGGALGGVLFGALSDRIGRTRTLILTILMYSLFTFATAFSQQWWHMVVLRFLVALGTGGEWAVASAMVAEVFPKKARAWSLGIFHASSVLGTYMAVLAGVLVVGNPRLGWRHGFVLGAVPALLTLAVRFWLKEPERWVRARQAARQDAALRTGRVRDLFSADLRKNSLLGISLATIGLATFWGVHIYGRNLLRQWAERPYLTPLRPVIEECSQRVRTLVAAVDQGLTAGWTDSDWARLREQLRQACEPVGVAAVRQFPSEQPADERLKRFAEQIAGTLQQTLGTASSADLQQRLAQLPQRLEKKMAQAVLTILPESAVQRIKFWEMLGMFLVTTGGGLGLLAFGPLSERVGRRGAFYVFHVGGLVSALALFQLLADASQYVLCVALPVFGFLTLGMHAGYAIYFPELFPTRVRGTGSGFCFNGGRFLAASVLVLRAWMRDENGLGLSLEQTASLFSLLFLLGLVLLLFAPETKGRELPE